MARRLLQPNGENCSMAELNTAIKAAVSRAEVRRMQAIKALLLGGGQEFVCELFSIERQTLVVWIKAFNAQGIDGLTDKPRPGRPSKIAPEQTERLIDLLRHPGKAEIVHWTAKKFHGHLRRELELEVGYSTVVRWLHEQQFRLKVPQPWPDRQNEEEREAFQERLKSLLSDETVELWFLDEMGVEGDPKPRRRWAKIGEKTRVTKNGDHVRMNVTGMICPRTGEAFLLEFTHNDREILQAFLDEANKEVALSRPNNRIICDNASWHKVKSMCWGKFQPLFLPAYSPDFNPTERLWKLIKDEWFTDFVAKDLDALIARLDLALNWAMARQDANQVTCAIH